MDGAPLSLAVASFCVAAGGDLAQDLRDIALEAIEVAGENASPGMEYDIELCRQEFIGLAADRLAHAALHAVAIDSLAQRLGNGEADACAYRDEMRR